MRVAILVVLLLPVPALADIAPTPAADCRRNDRVELADTATAAPRGFHRLDRLPPAAEFLTVYRRVGRCPVPAIVRYDVGRAQH